MHRSIQNIIDFREAQAARVAAIENKSAAWEWIAEFFGDNHDSDCVSCEWNWGKSGCRLLHSQGPNEPRFCPAFDNKGDDE